MKLARLLDEKYENVSGTVVDKLVSPKKIEKLEYELMPSQSTYGEGVHALQNSYAGKETEVPSHLWYEYNGRKIIRPLTFRENILARVENFETLKNKNGSTRTMEDRLILFDTLSHSCTGVAYSSRNEEDFMIIPVCKELITLPKNFSEYCIQLNYSSLQGKGFVLKRSHTKYDEQLTESEVITHPAWIAAVQEDIILLCTYTAIVFKQMSNGEDKLMGFYLKDKIYRDQLRSLFVLNRYNDSGALGGHNLINTVFFRATPPSS